MSIHDSSDSLWFLGVGTLVVAVPLFISGFVAGVIGYTIVISLISCILYFLYIYGQALGKSFANVNSSHESVINKNGVIISILTALYMIFLSFGIEQIVRVIKFQQPPGRLFYVWSVFFVSILLYSVLRFSYLKYNSEILRSERAIKKRYRERERVKREISRLEELFSKAIDSDRSVKHYIDHSEKCVRKYHSCGNLSGSLANYTTKLLIKAITEENYTSANSLFWSYVNVIVPQTGLCQKSSDVASNSLVLSLTVDDPRISQAVFDKLMERDFSMSTCTNSVLLYNLACFYSVNRKRNEMLLAVKRALELGKDVKLFLHDSDFAHYREDPEFLSILNGEPV